MLITLDNISRLVDNIKTWVSNNFISKDTQGGANFFIKCKVYSLSGTTIQTAISYAGNNMAGMWGNT